MTFVKKPVILTVTRFCCVAAISCSGVWVQIGKKWNNVSFNLSVSADCGAFVDFDLRSQFILEITACAWILASFLFEI